MAPKGVKVIASNRRARHDYLVLDTIECGLVLAGSEVKSLRDAKVQLGDAYARVERGELWLHNMHIARLRARVGLRRTRGRSSPQAPRAPRRDRPARGEGRAGSPDARSRSPCTSRRGGRRSSSPSRRAARATTAGRTWPSATRIGRCSVRWRTTGAANDHGPSDRAGYPCSERPIEREGRTIPMSVRSAAARSSFRVLSAA